MVVSFLSFKKVLASTPLGHIWRVHNHVKPYLPISNRYLKTAAQLRNDDFCPRNIYFDYERPDGLHNTNWLQLTGKYCSTKFIPVTRKVLLKKILEDESIIDNEEFDAFQKLSTGLDSALTAHYKHILKEMKSLYNPLCADRDTIQMKFFTEEELLKREKTILDMLEKLLQEANFYELPEDLMLKALDDHNVGESIVVSVSPKIYETLKFWVIGMDVVPIDSRPWYVVAGERAREARERKVLDHLSYRDYKRSLFLRFMSDLWTKMYGKEIQRVERYKRVIVAFRKKGQMKLVIKGFKDIPCDNLEFLLPDGKIRMRKLDKARLAMTGSVLFFFILTTTVVSLTEFKLETNVILGVAFLIITARNWSIYKNMRNAYLCNWSQTLYFKSIANNHALLTLTVDRAEDEVYKSALLIYSILHQIKKSGGKKYPKGLTSKDVKDHVEDWIKNKFEIDVNFCPVAALDYLQAFELVMVHEQHGSKFFTAVPLEESFKHLPMFKRTPMFHHADLLNINLQRTMAAKQEQESAYLDYEGRFDWN